VVVSRFQVIYEIVFHGLGVIKEIWLLPITPNYSTRLSLSDLRPGAMETPEP
jgi:hypothetical protein